MSACLHVYIFLSRRCVSQAANPCAAAAAVDRQAFIVREAEAMIGEPDPNRVMVSRHDRCRWRSSGLHSAQDASGIVLRTGLVHKPADQVQEAPRRAARAPSPPLFPYVFTVLPLGFGRLAVLCKRIRCCCCFLLLLLEICATWALFCFYCCCSCAT